MTIATPTQPVTQDEISKKLMNRYILSDNAQGTMMPSARLLAEEFGVSRLFIREVLAGLQRQGLIQSITGKGIYILKPQVLSAAKNFHTTARQSNATARDLVEARANLEEACVRMATLRATDADIELMEVALDSFDSANGLVPRAQADIAFHALIVKSTHNPVLQMMFGSITTLVFETMLRSLSDAEIYAKGAPIHRKILESIKDRKPDAASSLMGEHIHLAESSYKQDLDRKLSDIADRIVKEVLHSDLEIEDILDSALRDYKIEFLD
jgi:GntR family transcriptional repressor for pyruvate dehydrogenase complex